MSKRTRSLFRAGSLWVGIIWLAILVTGYPSCALAQKQELGLTLGQLVETSRRSTEGVPLRLGSGIALQANYGYRVWDAGRAELLLGVSLLANPQRVVTSVDIQATHDVASLYITPDVIVKLFPRRRLVPWGTIGGGYADYEQSTTVLGGQRNSAPRELARGALVFGGGIDCPVWKFVSLRGEVRDFYTGSPAYNVPVSGAQHNVVAGGGIVLHFGRK